jgi:hypothetical protein
MYLWQPINRVLAVTMIPEWIAVVCERGELQEGPRIIPPALYRTLSRFEDASMRLWD